MVVCFETDHFFHLFSRATLNSEASTWIYTSYTKNILSEHEMMKEQTTAFVFLLTVSSQQLFGTSSFSYFLRMTSQNNTVLFSWVASLWFCGARMGFLCEQMAKTQHLFIFSKTHYCVSECSDKKEEGLLLAFVHKVCVQFVCKSCSFVKSNTVQEVI